MTRISFLSTPDSVKGPTRTTGWALTALGVILIVSTACYDNNTGEATIGGAIKFGLPAFPESGPHAVEIFNEMHYQPSFRTQEGPRLLPHPDSVPVTGKELSYTSLEDYRQLKLPDRMITSYDYGEARRLYEVNCTVCHGSKMKGDGPIRPFMNRGPFPADLTRASTREITDGELFAFISLGGRQGLSAALRDRTSTSPMPEFRKLLTEEERWNLVQYLRAQ